MQRRCGGTGAPPFPRCCHSSLNGRELSAELSCLQPPMSARSDRCATAIISTSWRKKSTTSLALSARRPCNPLSLRPKDPGANRPRLDVCRRGLSERRAKALPSAHYLRVRMRLGADDTIGNFPPPGSQARNEVAAPANRTWLAFLLRRLDKSRSANAG